MSTAEVLSNWRVPPIDLGELTGRDQWLNHYQPVPTTEVLEVQPQANLLESGKLPDNPGHMVHILAMALKRINDDGQVDYGADFVPDEDALWKLQRLGSWLRHSIEYVTLYDDLSVVQARFTRESGVDIAPESVDLFKLQARIDQLADPSYWLMDGNTEEMIIRAVKELRYLPPRKLGRRQLVRQEEARRLMMKVVRQAVSDKVRDWRSLNAGNLERLVRLSGMARAQLGHDDAARIADNKVPTYHGMARAPVESRGGPPGVYYGLGRGMTFTYRHDPTGNRYLADVFAPTGRLKAVGRAAVRGGRDYAESLPDVGSLPQGEVLRRLLLTRLADGGADAITNEARVAYWLYPGDAIGGRAVYNWAHGISLKARTIDRLNKRLTAGPFYLDQEQWKVVDYFTEIMHRVNHMEQVVAIRTRKKIERLPGHRDFTSYGEYPQTVIRSGEAGERDLEQIANMLFGKFIEGRLVEPVDISQLSTDEEGALDLALECLDEARRLEISRIREEQRLMELKSPLAPAGTGDEATPYDQDTWDALFNSPRSLAERTWNLGRRLVFWAKSALKDVLRDRFERDRLAERVELLVGGASVAVEAVTARYDRPGYGNSLNPLRF